MRNVFNTSKYWAKRKNFLYYKIVADYVRYSGRDASTLMDVGSAQCPYLEWFDWIPNKISFDLSNPYSSDSVVPLKGDFLEYETSEVFDVVLCLQVLEHLEKPKLACDKLKAISKNLIVSVPYKWDPKKTMRGGHIQDPVDENKLQRWMGRKPDDFVVVSELFLPKWPRLIAYYSVDSPGVRVRADDFRAALLEREIAYS